MNVELFPLILMSVAMLRQWDSYIVGVRRGSAARMGEAICGATGRPINPVCCFAYAG